MITATSSSPLPAGFRGACAPRSAGIFLEIAAGLGWSAAVVEAFIKVEAAGAAYLPDGRPKILFERHKFYAYNGRRWSRTHSDISNPKSGGYKGGAAEYDRLRRAMALDHDAALKATSWGLPQIMGSNCNLAGYGSPEAMITDFCAGEDQQLRAFGAFIRSANLVKAGKALDWVALARGYNGANYAQGGYDRKLAAEYAAIISRVQHPISDGRAETAQIQAALNAAGYGPLAVDGKLTTAAIKSFQRARGLGDNGIVDAKTRAALIGTGASS